MAKYSRVWQLKTRDLEIRLDWKHHFGENQNIISIRLDALLRMYVLWLNSPLIVHVRFYLELKNL
jgi:hypothetical protein